MKRRFLASVFLLFVTARLLAGNLTVTFLDCGQGDAIVLHTPGNKTYLIDTGPNDLEHGGNFDAGKMVVVPFLNARRTNSLDGILISHPHLDHYGGTFAVIRAFAIKELIDAGALTAAPPYLRLLKEAELRNIKYRVVKTGDILDWDPEIKAEVLWPAKKGAEKKSKKKKRDGLNDQSIVLKITHGKNTFLFPGDAEKEAESELVRIYGHELLSKVLKAPHHGSKTSSTDEFLDAVNPQLAVISCGRRNRYHHPFPAVLERLEERKISFYRTDADGSIEVISDGKDLSIKALNPPAK